MSSSDAFAHGAAGAAGGVIAMALLYPLDNIRTRLQVQITRKHHSAAQLQQSPSATPSHSHTPQDSDSDSTSHSSSSHSPAAPSPTSGLPSEQYHFNGTLDCLRQVCAREGWQKLYSGLSSALIGVGASSAVYFYWYQHFKNMILSGTGKTSLLPWDNIVVASVAGVVNIFITLPIWVINTRMTLSNKFERYDSLAECVSKIYRNEGLAGFYKGLIPSLLLGMCSLDIHHSYIMTYTRSPLPLLCFPLMSSFKPFLTPLV